MAPLNSPNVRIQRWAQKALEFVRTAVQASDAEPALFAQRPIWDAGMFPDPSEFSQQLGRLQMSLQKPAQDVTESVRMPKVAVHQ